MSSNTVLVTNMPVPYRVPVFDLVGEELTGFTVIYCSKKESNRGWGLQNNAHEHRYLVENAKENADGYNYSHLNFDIWTVLNELKPEVVITTGFYGTQLIAFFWALTHRARRVVMTDGWRGSEAHLGALHRLVRKLVFKLSTAFIGASQGSKELYLSYDIGPEAIFNSVLPVYAESSVLPAVRAMDQREYDLLFVGRLEEPKDPMFFLATCEALAKSLNKNLNIRVVGEGSLFERMKERSVGIPQLNVHFDGFVAPDRMDEIYSSAKILLFPTHIDAWGMVIAEALKNGTPVIISDKTAAAYDLVENDINGFIMTEFTIERWLQRAQSMLERASTWHKYSAAAQLSILPYSYEAASRGILGAIEHVR